MNRRRRRMEMMNRRRRSTRWENRLGVGGEKEDTATHHLDGWWGATGAERAEMMSAFFLLHADQRKESSPAPSPIRQLGDRQALEVLVVLGGAVLEEEGDDVGVSLPDLMIYSEKVPGAR